MSSSSPPSSFSGAGSAEWAGTPGRPPGRARRRRRRFGLGGERHAVHGGEDFFRGGLQPGRKVALLVDPEPRAILVHDAEEPVVRVIQALRALQAQHQGPEEARAVHPLLGLRCRRFLVRPWGCPPQLGPQGLQPLSELFPPPRPRPPPRPPPPRGAGTGAPPLTAPPPRPRERRSPPRRRRRRPPSPGPEGHRERR